MGKTSKRRTQAERSRASDAKMFKAAIKLIAKDGPHKMTHARLGQVAGFSSGMVSYRFGTKINLLKETMDRICQLWIERVIVPAHAAEGGIESFELQARLYIDAIKAKSDLMLAYYRLMTESYSALKELQPAFRENDRRIRAQLVEGLRRSQEAGEIDKNVDLDAFVLVFMGILRGVAIQYFIDGDSIDIDAAYPEIVRLCESARTQKRKK